MFGQSQRTMALVVRTAGEPTAVRNPVQGVIRELDPTLPTFDVQPMSAVVRDSMARLSFMIVSSARPRWSRLLGAIGSTASWRTWSRARASGVRVVLGVAGIGTR
jgi:hypothetical protein